MILNFFAKAAAKITRLHPRPNGPPPSQHLALTFHHDHKGSVAVVFALSLIPMIALLGAGADYSAVEGQRVRLNAAADAAALTAVGVAARSLTAQEAKDRARKTFDANVSTHPQIALGAVNVEVVDTGMERKVTVAYSATYSTSFMKLYGVPELQFTSTIAAKGPLTPYVDFYLMLDNTPSMGLGATTADIDRLVANTPDRCAFACHQMDKPTADYYTLAKTLGVNMRIDVVRTATQSLMDTAKSAQIRDGQFRMSIHTFGSKAEEAGLKEIFSLSSNLTAAKSAAAAIDLMTIPYQNYRGDTQTDFDTAFGKMNKAIGLPGDGATASSPQKVLYYVSDGVNDASKTNCSKSLTYSSDGQTRKSFPRCQEPLDPTLCTTLKSRGIKIAVLYTTYFPLPTNSWYTKWIAPFQPQIATNMRSCASDGLYFEVSPSQGIAEAMNSLFLKTVNQISLTK